MKQTILSLLLLLSAIGVHAQWGAPYFPTGMTWQEQIISFDSGEPEQGTVETFEIGNDTIINGQTYKQIISNEKLEPVWIREQDNIIWLLTNLSPQETKLYDFNWDSQEEVTTTCFRYSEEGPQLFSESFMTKDVSTTLLNGKKVQYFRNGIVRTTICGIGNVIELNRRDETNHTFYCLLGYCMPQVVLPDMTFKKVISIQRNGEEIYRSNDNDDWIFMIPDCIKLIPTGNTSHYNDLQGRKVQGQPARGIYIKDGHKVVIK